MRSALTLARLLELLEVDTASGKLRRRIGVFGHAAGEPAGTSIGSNGYYRVRIDGKTYDVHRIIWLAAHGCWPAGNIDHINGDRTDNRIANLRVLSVRENAQNRTVARAGSRSGLIGAHWDAKRCTWKSEISVNGKRVNVGSSFATPEAAHAAYMAAKRILHPGFAR